MKMFKNCVIYEIISYQLLTNLNFNVKNINFRQHFISFVSYYGYLSTILEKTIFSPTFFINDVNKQWKIITSYVLYYNKYSYDKFYVYALDMEKVVICSLCEYVYILSI